MSDGILFFMMVALGIGALTAPADSASGHFVLVLLGWGFIFAAVCIAGGVVWKITKPARDRAEGRRNKRITDQVMKED